MDLRDLRYFETIAELENLARAAVKLHRTQPALSSSVRRLEECCGATLFEKSGRGLRLTDAGRTLLKWARRVRFDVEDARRELSAISAGSSGHVRLGIVPTAAQFLFPRVAREFIRVAPQATISTLIGLKDALKPRLQAGELDMIIATAECPEPGYVSRPLAEDTIVVVASACHEIFSGQPTLRDLVHQRWALQPRGAPSRDWLDHTFERFLLPRPVVQIETNTLTMLRELIIQTGLLSFFSRRHLQGPCGKHGLKEIPVPEAMMQRRIVVIYREHGFMSPAAERLMELFVHASSSDSLALTH